MMLPEAVDGTVDGGVVLAATGSVSVNYYKEKKAFICRGIVYIPDWSIIGPKLRE